jgi:hypothetical protein
MRAGLAPGQGTTTVREWGGADLSRRNARIAIQLQPAMMPMRWINPVGALGTVPSISRTEVTLLPMRDAKTTTPVMIE